MVKDFGMICRKDAEMSTPAAKHMKYVVLRCPQPENRRMVKMPKVVIAAAMVLVANAVQKIFVIFLISLIP